MKAKEEGEEEDTIARTYERAGFSLRFNQLGGGQFVNSIPFGYFLQFIIQ